MTDDTVSDRNSARPARLAYAASRRAAEIRRQGTAASTDDILLLPVLDAVAAGIHLDRQRQFGAVLIGGVL